MDEVIKVEASKSVLPGKNIELMIVDPGIEGRILGFITTHNGVFMGQCEEVQASYSEDRRKISFNPCIQIPNFYHVEALMEITNTHTNTFKYCIVPKIPISEFTMSKCVNYIPLQDLNKFNDNIQNYNSPPQLVSNEEMSDNFYPNCNESNTTECSSTTNLTIQTPPDLPHSMPIGQIDSFSGRELYSNMIAHEITISLRTAGENRFEILYKAKPSFSLAHVRQDIEDEVKTAKDYFFVNNKGIIPRSQEENIMYHEVLNNVPELIMHKLVYT